MNVEDDQPGQTSAPSRMRWLILAACVTARSGIGLQFIAVAALMPLIRAELALTYTEIGLLLGLFMVVGIFLSVPSGMIAARWGDRQTLFVGLAALFISGSVTAWADGFGLMLAGRVIGGLGAVVVTLTAAKILTDWFAGKEISTAMGCLGMSWPLGIAIGLSLLPTLAGWWNWQVAIQWTVLLPGLAVVFALLLPSLGRPPAPVKGWARSPLWSISGRELMAVLAAGSAWPLMSSGGYVVFSSYAPELITGHGYSHAEAALALSLASWLTMMTIPIGGWMADKWGRGDGQYWAGCLLSAALIAIVPLGGPVVLWVALTAVMGITVGPIMALPSQILSPASRSTGLGIYYAVYYGGTVILPAAAGWLLDRTGSAAGVVWFAAACLVVSPLFLVWCRALQRRWGLGG